MLPFSQSSEAKQLSGQRRLHVLAGRVIQRDHEAWRELRGEITAPILMTASRILRSHKDAEAVTKDVLSYVWHHTATYEEKYQTVFDWVTTVTRVRALERLRFVYARTPAEARTDGAAAPNAMSWYQ